jgi:hypothetical protein
MSTGVLIMGLIFAGIFIIPIYFAVKFARKGSSKLQRLFTEESLKKGFKVSKLEIIGQRGLGLDTDKNALLWFDSKDNMLTGSEVILLKDTIESRVMINGSPMAKKLDNNLQVNSVKLRLMFAQGDKGQANLVLFDNQTDDPLAAADTISIVRKWNDVVQPYLRSK